ncbi:tyrosine-type recombinase/integrase [Clostridium sp.]|uniref:tyrosine-type recombinase/integrase n=1 Tax=Clostridium sp. TaxID=1506 RepID=UPI003216B32C
MQLSKLDLQIDDFMSYCESKNLSKKTMRSYEATLKLFARYLQDTLQIDNGTKVNDKIVREYILYLKDRGKYTVTADESSRKYNNPHNRQDNGKMLSASTLNNYIRNIKVFYNFLYETRQIKTNTVKKVQLLKNDRKPQDFISDDDFIKLIKALNTSKYHEYRDYVLIQLLIDTGMRIGETLQILTEDIDINNRCIYLQAENTKSKKERNVFFSVELSKELRGWLQYKDRYVDSEYLFCTSSGNTLDIRSLEKNFRQYGQRISISLHPHQLRNNFAKRFLMAGGNIYTLSKILGHSSVTVTEKAYLDLTDADIKQSYQSFSPLSGIKSRRK